MAVTSINGIDIDDLVGGDGVKSGIIDVKEGGLKVSGQSLGPSALDFRNKVVFFTDFLGDAADSSDEPLITETEGSGTGNAVTGATSDPGGTISITSASDDGAITANASAIEIGGVAWQADQGNLVMEVGGLTCDDVSEAYVFVGFTDVVPSTTLEAPVFLNSANIDSDAANACGVFFDKDGTTGDQWCHGGVKANTDTAPAYTGTTLTDAFEQTIRVEVSSAGAVQGFVDGEPIGDAVANAVTATTPLVPVIVVANRSANAVVVTADYVHVSADRP